MSTVRTDERSQTSATAAAEPATATPAATKAPPVLAPPVAVHPTATLESGDELDLGLPSSANLHPPKVKGPSVTDATATTNFDSSLRRLAVLRRRQRQTAGKKSKRGTLAPGPRAVTVNPKAVLAVVLLLILGWRLWSVFEWRLVTWPADTELITRVGGDPFATVLEYSAQHYFPNGESSPAYRVRLHDQAERWLPKLETFQLAEPRP